MVIASGLDTMTKKRKNKSTRSTTTFESKKATKQPATSSKSKKSTEASATLQRAVDELYRKCTLYINDFTTVWRKEFQKPCVAVAANHKIAASTLKRAFLRALSHPESSIVYAKSGPKKALSDLEEKKLRQWIINWENVNQTDTRGSSCQG